MILLTELLRLRNNNLSPLIKIVSKFIHDWIGGKELNAAVNTLLKIPEYRFQGKMYRGLFLSHETLLKASKTKNLQPIIDYILKVERHSERKYISWSDTIGKSGKHGVMQVMGTTREHYHEGVILQQNSIGLDVNKLFTEYKKHGKEFQIEQEILAKYSNRVRIVGFFDSRNHVYSVSQYQKFLKTLQTGKQDSEKELDVWIKRIQNKYT